MMRLARFAVLPIQAPGYRVKRVPGVPNGGMMPKALFSDRYKVLGEGAMGRVDLPRVHMFAANLAYQG